MCSYSEIACVVYRSGRIDPPTIDKSILYEGKLYGIETPPMKFAHPRFRLAGGGREAPTSFRSDRNRYLGPCEDRWWRSLDCVSSYFEVRPPNRFCIDAKEYQRGERPFRYTSKNQGEPIRLVLSRKLDCSRPFSLFLGRRGCRIIAPNRYPGASRV